MDLLEPRARESRLKILVWSHISGGRATSEQTSVLRILESARIAAVRIELIGQKRAPKLPTEWQECRDTRTPDR